MDYKRLGEELKNGRKNKGYTQSMVAGLINVTPQNISSWELGKSKMDIDRYVQLCRLYDLDYVKTMQMCSPDTNLPHFPIESYECNHSAITLTVTEQERELIDFFRELNTEGKDALLSQAETMTCMSKYKKCDELSSLA